MAVALPLAVISTVKLVPHVEPGGFPGRLAEISSGLEHILGSEYFRFLFEIPDTALGFRGAFDSCDF